MNTKNKFAAGILAVSISTLFGCGGGSSLNSNTGASASPSSPHELSAREFQNVDVLSANRSIQAPIVTSDETSITLSFHTADFSPGQHAQFFLNIDNNASTGFIFNSEAWDKAGTDYIIEDGHLFKSTANDNSWSWNENVGEVEYSLTGGSDQGSTFSVKINKSLLPELSSVIRAGFLHRDADWNVKAFYPNSTLMQEYRINVTPPASDTIPPVITIIGSKTETVLINKQYIDTGADAFDNVDGNITARIQTSSDVDTSKIGTYHIIYSVADQAGNTSSVTRTVKVVEQTTNGIVVDGQDSDWMSIPALSETASGIIKATEKNGKLYIMIKDGTRPFRDNTQIFLDVDSDSATGFQFNGDIWNRGGADYMIENDHLDKAKANSSSWAWDYNAVAIDIVRTGNIVELAIPKSSLNNLGSTLTIGYVHRDQDWSVNNVLPDSGMVSYTLNTTPPSTSIPEDVEVALCTNPTGQSLVPTGSLDTGVVFAGSTYQMKPIDAENYALWVTKNGVSSKLQEFASRGRKPRIFSTSGALYFFTYPFDTANHNVISIWRATPDNTITNVKQQGGNSSARLFFSAIAYNGQSDYLLSSFSGLMGGGSRYLDYRTNADAQFSRILQSSRSENIQMYYKQDEIYVAIGSGTQRSVRRVDEASHTLIKLGKCSLTPPPPPVPTAVKNEICRGHHTQPSTDTLETGIVYNRKTYQMKQDDAANFSLWVTSNGNKKKIKTFHTNVDRVQLPSYIDSYKPVLVSTNGALYFLTRPFVEGITKQYWRVNNDDTVSLIENFNRRIRDRNHLLHISYLGTTDYFLTKQTGAIGEFSNALGYINANGERITLLSDSVTRNDVSKALNIKMFYYEDNQYVGYTKRKYRDSSVISSEYIVNKINDTNKTLEKIGSCSN